MEKSSALRMKQSEFVTFLATISATTALGIDMILPSFGAVREEFGLGEDSTSVALTVTTYFIGLSVSQILYGPFADRFGRKPVLLFGVTAYGVAAIACALAPNLTFLLIGRLLWGIGAAGPRVLLMAIARDVYDGDRLAKVLSMAAALFMIVPAVAPLLGQAVLDLTSWRGAFAAPAIPAAALAVWAWLRLDETLAPDRRRPLTLGRTRQAVKAVVSNRTAFGYSLAQMFDFASFASFLATTELLFDRVYDRSDQFALSFGGMSLLMGATAFLGSRIVGQLGARRMILTLFPINVAIATVLFFVSYTAGGSPNFWLWFGLLTIGNSLRVLINPLAGSESMQPMGELAGTAASVMGTIGMGGGAILASFTDRLISDSVTPLSAAYMLYGVAGLTAAVWASRDPGTSSGRDEPLVADPVT